MDKEQLLESLTDVINIGIATYYKVEADKFDPYQDVAVMAFSMDQLLALFEKLPEFASELAGLNSELN